MTNELYHHGIKGQKWGIRRYQNPDGSLTDVGKQRYAKKIFNEKLHPADRQLQEYRTKVLLDNKVYEDLNRIDKGSSIHRLSSEKDEKLDNRRKYAYTTAFDRQHYVFGAKNNLLGFTDKQVYENFYTPIKTIKIANEKKFSDDVIKTYGDKTIKRLWKEYNQRGDSYNRAKLAILGMSNDPMDKQVYDYVRDGQTKLNEFFHEKLYTDTKISSEIFNKYSKKGYDAVVDMEDRVIGYDYPIILLNPKESVRLVTSQEV